MVEIANNYYVDADYYNYTLLYKTDKTDKNGNDKYLTLGYFDSMKSAIRTAIERMTIDEVPKEEITQLRNWVSNINKANEKLENILKGVDINGKN